MPLSWPNRALPPAYGTAAERPFGAWDYQTMHGCVCDSSWLVIGYIIFKCVFGCVLTCY